MERSITLQQQQIEGSSNKANLVNELRKLNSDIKISWLAAHPASKLIEEAGEYLLPEAVQYSNDNILAEKAAKGPQLNLLKYLTKASKEWKNNMALFNRITNEKNYDITIGDETCEIIVGFQKNPSQKKAPFVMIFDFIGLEVMTNDPTDWLGAYIWNRVWSFG